MTNIYLLSSISIGTCSNDVSHDEVGRGVGRFQVVQIFPNVDLLVLREERENERGQILAVPSSSTRLRAPPSFFLVRRLSSSSADNGVDSVGSKTAKITEVARARAAAAGNKNQPPLFFSCIFLSLQSFFILLLCLFFSLSLFNTCVAAPGEVVKLIRRLFSP